MEENKKKKKGKFKKFFLIGTASLLLISVVVHFVWKSSGSDEWKIIDDKGGVQVYTKKVPGDPWLKFKVTGHVNASMKSIIRFIRDPRAADDAGTYDAYMLDSINSELVYYAFKQKYFFPFKPREYIVRSNFRQDTLTKTIYTDFIAEADKIPLEPENGCFRVTKMNNQWWFNPVGDGKVEYIFISDAEDPGGNFPYFLANFAMSLIYMEAFAKMPDLMDKPHYKAGNVDYVMDVE